MRKTPLKDERLTLASQGVDKNLAKEARKLGALSDEQFERTVTATREAVTKAGTAVLNAIDKKANRADRERVLAEKVLETNVMVSSSPIPNGGSNRGRATPAEADALCWLIAFRRHSGFAGRSTSQ